MNSWYNHSVVCGSIAKHFPPFSSLHHALNFASHVVLSVMRHKCCAPDCPSNSDNFSLFNFPKKYSKCQEWVAELKKAYPDSDLDLNLWSRICELHFGSECFPPDWAKRHRIRLLNGARPTVLKRLDVLLNIRSGSIGLPGKVYNCRFDGLITVEESDQIVAEVVDIDSAEASASICSIYKKSLHSYAEAPAKSSRSKKKLGAVNPSVDLDALLSSCSSTSIEKEPEDNSQEMKDFDISSEPSTAEKVEYSTDLKTAFGDSEFVFVEMRKLKELFPSVCEVCGATIEFFVDTSSGSGAVVNTRCSKRKSSHCWNSSWSSHTNMTQVKQETCDLDYLF